MAAKKARAEGAKSPASRKPAKPQEVVAPPVDEEPIADENGPEPEDLANPVPGDDGDALDRIAEYFRFKFPEEWANIRLCPLQHGIPAMADILRGRG